MMQMRSISLLVPTRDRPVQLMRMLDSAFQNVSRSGVLEVVLYVDDDDEVTQRLDLSKYNVRRLVGPRRSMGILNSACFAASTGDVIVLGNDDVIIQTKGWEQKILDEANSFPDAIFLLYPNDLFKGEKLASFPILSRKTCDEIADPFPGEYRGAFIDLHIMDVFRRLQGAGESRVKFLEDVVFEHLHFRAGKSDNDTTYDQRDRFGDDETFMALCGAREWAARRLLSVIRIARSETGGAGSKPSVPRGEAADVLRPQTGWFISLSLQILRDGSAKLRWRVKLFFWLWARLLYRKLVATIRRNGK